MRKIKYWAAGLAAAISILATACGQATASNAQETAKITTEAVTETAKTAADAATETASESVTVETAQIPKAAAAQVKASVEALIFPQSRLIPDSPMLQSMTMCPSFRSRI